MMRRWTNSDNLCASPLNRRPCRLHPHHGIRTCLLLLESFAETSWVSARFGEVDRDGAAKAAKPKNRAVLDRSSREGGERIQFTGRLAPLAPTSPGSSSHKFRTGRTERPGAFETGFLARSGGYSSEPFPWGCILGRNDERHSLRTSGCYRADLLLHHKSAPPRGANITAVAQAGS